MQALFGHGVGVFLGVTVCLMGFAAFMTGKALAETWKPAWHAAGYACLLGLADRFLAYALFGGELLSLAAYAIDSAVLAAIALFAHRLARARKMVAQYPWLYERAGVLDWREKSR
jgi:hypothetical protein